MTGAYNEGTASCLYSFGGGVTFKYNGLRNLYMVTIVAISGGEIGRPGTKKEILLIDKRIIALTGKPHPNLLFVPTASSDSDGYCAVAEQYFAKLGARVRHLRIIRDKPSKAEMRAAVKVADIVYVGGGNTKDMLRIWTRTGFSTILRSFEETKKIYCGVSAGAVCWFDSAWSDSLRMKDPNAPYVCIPCLGIVPGMYNPHAVREPKRLPALKAYLKKHGGVAYSVDDCAAIVVHKGEATILSAKRGRAASIILAQHGCLTNTRVPKAHS